MAVGMGGAMLFYQVFVPLLLVATPSSSEEKFGLTGGSIVLQAKPMPEKVSNIIWKHNKDKAAEWFDIDDAPTYYNIFKDVTTLNMQTWALTISNLHPRFNGKYSAEVNNKDPTQFVTLAVLGPVSKPEITTDCNDPKINCTLTCEGKEVKFTKYTWANDIDEWTGSELPVERRDHDVVYTCNFSNPVSWATSQGTVKKYVPPPPPPSGPTGGIIGVIIIVGFILYACICLLVFKMQGKGCNDLGTMTCQDRCRIFIPCIKVTSPVPSGKGLSSADDHLLQDVTVTSPVPPGQDQSSEAEPMLPGVSGGVKPPEVKTDSSRERNPTENGPGPTADGEPEEPNGGKENHQLPNTVTPPVPSGEDNSPELDHRLPSVTERKEPDGNEDSPGMPNPEDKRQPETDPDPAPEEKLPANAPGSTAEEEHKEPEGGEKSSEKTNTEDKRQPETDTDPLLEGKLPANAPGSTAEEENNEAHGGKESPEKTNTEDEKLPKADTDQLHEEKLGEPVETSTADGENNEAHGGKESPEKTNTEH